MNEALRKLTAVLLGIGTSGILFLMYSLASIRWLFFLFAIFWIASLFGASLFFKNIWRAVEKHLPLTITTFLACAGLMTLLEQRPFIFFIICLAGLFISLIFGWTTHEEASAPGLGKPFRRMKMMLWVFDAYALTCTIFAIGIFFPYISFWFLLILSAFIFAFISFMVWKLYYLASVKNVLIWLLLVGLVMIEIVWVLHLLPLGYLVNGLLATWVWYILQLFARFHFAEIGVVWKRQIWFLSVNAVLFTAVLFLARWIPQTR